MMTTLKRLMAGVLMISAMPTSAVAAEKDSQTPAANHLPNAARGLTFKGRHEFIKESAGAAAPKPAAEWDDRLYRPFASRPLREPDEGTVEISLIPHYAWANRGLSYMEVWIPLAR